MKFQQNRAGEWDVETMLATGCILAGRINCGLFTQMGFASEREDSPGRIGSALVGVDVNGDRLWTALLTRPTANVRAAGVYGNAVNVANNATGARVLTRRFGTNERRQA